MLQDLEAFKEISDRSDLTRLFALTRHPEHYIRAKVAQVVPMQIFFDNLAHDSHPAVRAAIVSNKTTSIAQVEVMAAAEFARKDMRWPVLQALASKVGLGADVYQHLYHIGEWDIWIGLVHNPSCPTTILETLARLPVEMKSVNPYYAGYDKNKEIRRYACTRTGIPDHSEKND